MAERFSLPVSLDKGNAGSGNEIELTGKFQNAVQISKYRSRVKLTVRRISRRE